MEKIYVKEILEAVDGQLLGNIDAETRFVTNVQTDSRAAAAGDLFVAIVGERLDAHRFVPGAMEAGADKIVVLGTSSSRSAKRLALAREFGATHTVCVDKEDPVEVIRDITNGAMADVYMDVSGQPHNVEIASDLLRFHGNFVLPGLYGQHFPALDLDKIVQKEINMFGVLAQSYQANEAAVKIIESRKYPIEKMVTHWFELEDAEKGVLLTAGELKDEVDPIKCVICPNGLPEGRKATKL